MKDIFAPLIEKKEYHQKRFRTWFLEHAKGPYAEKWLAFFSFTESIFFPIPTAFYLIALLGADSARWVYLALLTAITSVLGGILGYVIGLFFFEVVGIPIIAFYNLEDAFAHVGGLFENNAFWVLFAGAFTPIPFKVFTLGAGFFKINFLMFFFVSLFGRLLQFFAIALFMRLYGTAITKVFYRYFGIATFLLVVLLVIVLFVL